MEQIPLLFSEVSAGQKSPSQIKAEQKEKRSKNFGSQLREPYSGVLTKPALSLVFPKAASTAGGRR